MKRKPSQQLMNVISNPKQTMKRLKSPQNKRTQFKKEPDFHSIVLQRQKHIKSKQQVKGDSNNTTATTKPKSQKSKKHKQKHQDHLGGSQIMELITSFAIKIQRQWRVYLLRKRFKQFIKSIHPEEKQPIKNQFVELKFDNKKIKRLVQFQEEEEIVSGTSLYDKSKYQNMQSGKQLLKSEKSEKSQSVKSKSKKNLGISKSSNTTPRNRLDKSSSTAKTPRQHPILGDELSRSLEKPSSARTNRQIVKQKEERRASFNTFEERKFLQNRRHSTGELQPPLRVVQKSLQIDKVFEIRVEHSQKLIKKKSEQSPNISKKWQSQATIAFHKNQSIQKVMRKCKKDLQINKLRQLLSVQNRYNKNEVTYRSYLDVIGKINQEHSHKLQLIKQKQGQLKSTLGELFQIYKANHQEARFAEDDPQSSHSHLDVSLSFDRWDFNSSAKKSIDPLDFPEGNGSKIISIQSVLRQLDEEENPGPNQRFKKNKSLQMIEAIAERSKEISDKSICEFQEVPQNTVDAIAIQEPEKDGQKHEKQVINRLSQIDMKELSSPSIKSSNSLKFQEQKNETQKQDQKQFTKSRQIKAEDIHSSNSLLITPAGPPQLAVSEESIDQNRQIINDMIFKEIKTPEVNYEEPLVAKFRQLVVQTTVMVNIKMISSLKFLFARACENRRKKLASKHPSIHPDINSINSWLLQISHFMLDSYQKDIYESLVKVRQPSISEVLLMGKKQVHTTPLYESIPEYVFKDFQFCYIKSLSKNYAVKDEDYDKFSQYVYIFHRALIDSLNTSLMEELVTGKEWIITPWKTNKKFKSIQIVPDYAKICLERSINVVSNWAEYGLGRLDYQQDFSQAEYRQFEEQKINLVCREEILEQRLNPTFSIGHILLKLVESQIQKEFLDAAKDIFQLMQ